MFIALLISVLVTVHAAKEIPSYIHPCGRKDPNYDQCIVDNVNNLTNKICTGMPELNVPPLEYITINEIVIYNTNNLKLYLNDIKLRGYCDVIINSFYTSPDKLHFEFDLLFKHLNVDTVYDFNMHLLVSIANKGLVHLSSDNIGMKLVIEFKEVIKNGKTEIYASKVNISLNIKTFKYKFDDSEKDLIQLHTILNNIINENEKDFFNAIIPEIEKTVSKKIISVVNNITHNRYEQLFPDEV